MHHCIKNQHQLNAVLLKHGRCNKTHFQRCYQVFLELFVIVKMHSIFCVTYKSILSYRYQLHFLHMSWQSYYDAIQFVSLLNTAWKESKYGVLPGPYFHAFGLNTERYSVSLRIQSECRKIRTRKNSVFGHFSRSASCKDPQIQQTIKCLSNTVLFM